MTDQPKAFVQAAPLYQVSLEVGKDTAERIATVLENGEPAPLASGWFEIGKDRFEVFAHYDAPPCRETIIALLSDAGGGVDPAALRIEAVPSADWVTLSQGRRGPVRAGRFLVHGSHDRHCMPALRGRLEIDAGQAFGTAHHATTRACLLALDDLLKRHSFARVVDLGTGSGLLAIAAAKALRQPVLASDNDPIAVATAMENARKNGAAALVRAVRADGLMHPAIRGLRSDLVFANLLDSILRQLAPQFAASVAPGGRAVLSGITTDQSRGIEALYLAYGFVLERRIVLDGWTALLLKRINTRPNPRQHGRD